MDAKTTSTAGQEIVAVRLSVHGRVQGVGFRRFARSAAQQHGLAGWVRNAYDGSVEIWAEGPRRAVTIFLETVRKGPSGSWVTDVEETWFSPDGSLNGFTVRY